MYVSKQDKLRMRLHEFLDVIQEARDTGLTDLEIVNMLGLRPRGLGRKTRMILRAIQQGEIKPDDSGAITALAVAKHINKTRGAALYHLNILRDAGYIK